VVGTCDCGNEPSGSVKWANFLTIREPISFSRRTVFHGVIKSIVICIFASVQKISESLRTQVSKTVMFTHRFM
jgi:hypothetical protein